MSTRCLVSFSVVCGDSARQVKIYKHYDGQPKNMVPFLKEFIKWNKDKGETETDPGSIGANFIYWAKIKDKDNSKKGIRSEENLGKFFRENVSKDVKNIVPVGNYAIHSHRTRYMMPMDYLYTVTFYLKIPKHLDDAPVLLRSTFAIVDKIEIVVGEPQYKDIDEEEFQQKSKESIKNSTYEFALELDKIETIDTIEIKRGEGEKKWKN